MKNKFEIFLDTDIFLEHLSGKKYNEVSILQKCRNTFNGCYTSVINASEVFSEYPGKRFSGKVKAVFDGTGILGIPFRYSVKIGEILSSIKKKVRETLLEMLWL